MKEKQIAFIYTETNGLHKKMSYDEVNAKNLHTWARLVAIYYQTGYRDSETGKIIIKDKKKIIIKPEDFVISNQSTAIHCIDNDTANEQGSDIKEILKKLETDLKTINIIISHNLVFHIRAIQAECFRHKVYIKFNNFVLIDIMNFNHKFKMPKLEELTFNLIKKNYDKKPRSYKVIMIKKCFAELYNKYEEKHSTN